MFFDLVFQKVKIELFVLFGKVVLDVDGCYFEICVGFRKFGFSVEV